MVSSDLLESFANMYKISVDDILDGEKREKKVTDARHHLWWELWKESDLTLEEIGNEVGKRKPAAVHFGIKEAIKRIERREKW